MLRLKTMDVGTVVVEADRCRTFARIYTGEDVAGLEEVCLGC